MTQKCENTLIKTPEKLWRSCSELCDKKTKYFDYPLCKNYVREGNCSHACSDLMNTTERVSREVQIGFGVAIPIIFLFIVFVVLVIKRKSLGLRIRNFRQPYPSSPQPEGNPLNPL